MSLISHLAGVNNTRGWEACQTQLQYHGGKLSQIRGKYRQRLQMVCRVYTYLRDGQSKTWMSLRLQETEISNIRSRLSQPGVEATQGYNCSHCKSALHGGGRTSCPWINKPAAEAKKAANAFMARMADGSVAAAIP